MAAQGGPASKQVAYDPESFYVRATDNRGHKEKISFGVPPDVYAQVMKFVGDEQFSEYDSPADVFRDAVVHLMAKRRDQLADPLFREGIDRVHRDLQHWREIDAMETQAMQWQVSLDKVRKIMVQLSKDKAWEQMETSLHRCSLMTETMGEPYATKMREEIQTWTKKLPANL